MKKIYLDHNATTPVLPEVIEAMTPYFGGDCGNASSIHSFGRAARVAVERCREKIAESIGCSPEELTFTSGGTESDNLAVKGAAFARMNRGRHIITSAIEHHAVLESCHYLERKGFEVTYLKPDREGTISPDELRRAIRPDTILVSIMHANNEIGTIQEIGEMAAIAHEKEIVFHTDAVQSTGKIKLHIGELGVDLFSASAHKFYGPKGAGFLYVRKKVKIEPLSHGGSHEFNRRAGTENVPGIVGMAKALELAAASIQTEADRLSKMKEKFIGLIKQRVSDVMILGRQDRCVPNTVSIAFRGVEAESIALGLDLKGIAVSTGSACSSGSMNASHVINALGLPPEYAHGAIRFSFGRSNSIDEIDEIVETVAQEVVRMRTISPIR